MNENVNKVVLGDRVLIDLTNDTVTAEDVAEGITFHAADGSIQVGANKGGGGSMQISFAHISENTLTLDRDITDVIELATPANGLDITVNIPEVTELLTGAEIGEWQTGAIVKMVGDVTGFALTTKAAFTEQYKIIQNTEPQWKRGYQYELLFRFTGIKYKSTDAYCISMDIKETKIEFKGDIPAEYAEQIWVGTNARIYTADIDTGLKPVTNMTFELTANIESGYTNGSDYLLVTGVTEVLEDASSSSMFVAYGKINSSDNYTKAGSAVNKYPQSSGSYIALSGNTSPYHFKLIANEDGWISECWKGNSSYHYTTSGSEVARFTGRDNLTFHLFNRQKVAADGTKTVDNYSLYWKIQRFKFYADGVLVRDFIPIKRNSDNKLGFWDLCGSESPFNGTPFYSQTSANGLYTGGDK